MLISILVISYNRCQPLMTTLESLIDQKLDGSFQYEVIVVDNNSNDGTRDAVAAKLPLWNGRLKYLFEPTQGKSYALNKGVNESKGDIIAFTDDDVVVDPQWLTTIVQLFKITSCDGVGGRVLPQYPPETPQWVKDNAVQLAGAVVIYDYGQGSVQLEESMYPFIGANFAFKRNVFEECGLFRVDMGPGTPLLSEDSEFCQRLLKKGKTLYYCGKALVWHPYDPKRLTLKHMAKWHMALGRFDAHQEMQGGQPFVYCGPVPRYLIKGIMIDFLHLFTGCFNRIAFLNAWRSFFRKAGMIQEYRKPSRKELS